MDSWTPKKLGIELQLDDKQIFDFTKFGGLYPCEGKEMPKESEPENDEWAEPELNMQIVN